MKTVNETDNVLLKPFIVKQYKAIIYSQHDVAE